MAGQADRQKERPLFEGHTLTVSPLYNQKKTTQNG